MAFKKLQGVSLLELMIAMLLSAILMVEIFRYSYFLESTLKFSALKVESIEKNNVLFAWLVRDIEMAGYVGCLDAGLRKNVIDNNGYLSETWLSVHDGTLESQYMSPQQFLVLEKTSENEVSISGNNTLKEDDIVIIENCWEAETVKIKKIHSVNYNEKNRLEFYAPLKIKNIENTYLAKLIRHNYIIRYSSGLYMINEKGDSSEILQNISSMSITSEQNNFIISVNQTQGDEPIVLAARAYNAR